MTTEEALAQYARDLPIGQYKKKCPSCSGERSKKSDPCLSVQVAPDKMVYKCHHCQMDGIIPFRERHQMVQMHNFEEAKVRKVDHLPLTEDALDWLDARGISQSTANAVKVFSTTHWINAEGAKVPCIGFPYHESGKEKGAKIRSLSTKGFSCTSPLRTFFNVDSIEENDILIICEGEMDALSLIEAGMTSVVSVPNGAVAKLSDGSIDPREDKSFSFLWDSKDLLDAASKIVIATDADKAGQTMAEELARRIGRDRCWKVDWPQGCKDANDVLCEHGGDVLADLVVNCKPWPIVGIYDADHFADEVRSIYLNGFGGGATTGYVGLDEYYTVVAGQLTVVTGVPSSGKSEFVDQIMVNQAKQFGVKFAICSFENEPKLHIAKLLAKHREKPFFEGPTQRMSEEELDESLAFIDEHFTFLSYKDGKLASLDDILERLKIAVMRHGIRGAVIDPYNYIARDHNMSETDWISEMLTRVCAFAQSYDVHIWFVAHPTKMQRDNGKIPVPKGYDISGSAAWFAKADCGITVHRPNYETTDVEIHIWKCRFSWVGKQGECKLTYDPSTSTYRDYNDRYFSTHFSGKKEYIEPEVPF
jgi:twinkle protein